MIDIKGKTSERLDNDFGIDPQLTESLFDMGWLDESKCRNVLIKEEYMKRSHSRRKTDVKLTLAEKYCVSFSTVDKLVMTISTPSV